MADQTGIEPAVSSVTGRHVNRYTTDPFDTLIYYRGNKRKKQDKNHPEQEKNPSHSEGLSFQGLIVLLAEFEEGARMLTSGTDFGGEFADVDVTAVSAFPNDDVFTDEDFATLDIG